MGPPERHARPATDVDVVLQPSCKAVAPRHDVLGALWTTYVGDAQGAPDRAPCITPLRKRQARRVQVSSVTVRPARTPLASKPSSGRQSGRSPSTTAQRPW